MTSSTSPHLAQLPSTFSMPDIGYGFVRPSGEIGELLGYADDAFNPLISQLVIIGSTHAGLLGSAITSTSPTSGLVQRSPVFVTHTHQVESPWIALRRWLLDRVSEVVPVDDKPQYEKDRQHIDQDRISSLRRAGAHESADIYRWYEQKEE
jgi:hypothetical protein